MGNGNARGGAGRPAERRQYERARPAANSVKLNAEEETGSLKMSAGPPVSRPQKIGVESELALLSPNGGEELEAGTIQHISCVQRRELASRPDHL